MSRLKIIVRNYFGFSRTETNAFFILLPLMVGILSSEPAYRWWYVNHLSSSVPEVDLDSLVVLMEDKAKQATVKEKPVRSLFAFDPNTASTDELTTLGFSRKIATRIAGYRSKGGKFRTKKDLEKIYGIDRALLRQLDPFVRLPAEMIGDTSTHVARSIHRKAERFDINLADSTRLVSVFGVGPKLSARILAYRDRLGGFVSLQQLREVYGLDSSVVRTLSDRAFVGEEFRPRQIDVNKADNKTLTSIPYIRFNLAKAITLWRLQHGNFRSLDELRQIVILDEPTFQKIIPYLTVND